MQLNSHGHHPRPSSLRANVRFSTPTAYPAAVPRSKRTRRSNLETLTDRAPDRPVTLPCHLEQSELREPVRRAVRVTELVDERLELHLG